MKRLKISDDAAGLFRTLHPEIKRKIKASFQAILNDPQSGKRLKNELEGLRSFRAGKFRVIYRVGEGGIIEIVAVGPRKAVYEETARLLRK